MKIKYVGRFTKHFNQRIKSHTELTDKFQERLDLFLKSPKNPILKDHQLKGNKKYLRTFSVTGDIRVIYFIEDKDLYLVDIGSHNQVY